MRFIPAVSPVQIQSPLPKNKDTLSGGLIFYVPRRLNLKRAPAFAEQKPGAICQWSAAEAPPAADTARWQKGSVPLGATEGSGKRLTRHGPVALARGKSSRRYVSGEKKILIAAVLPLLHRCFAAMAYEAVVLVMRHKSCQKMTCILWIFAYDFFLVLLILPNCDKSQRCLLTFL